MAAKINEAHDHIAKAEKYLKTSFMKWKPDYDSAASEYSKAAVAFKNAKMLEEAKEAYLQEAEAHTNNKTALEAAGMMLKDMQRIPEAIQYIERASMMYVENGTPDTAALALDRAGKLDEAAVSIQKEKNMYKEIENYPTCFKGYDQQDDDQVQRVCNSPLFKYMDNDYAKLSISLRVPGGGKKKKAPAAAADAGEGRAGAGEADEDEYAGGLC
ncbi:unnamed protein product [Coregonus sp. 'balchen']|nr:unnamed protein product [Coregonus sp. 'balchen']